MRRNYASALTKSLAIGVLALIVIVAIATGVPLKPGSTILPGAEGLYVGVYGFQVGDSATVSTANTLPLPYSWVARDVQNAIVQYDSGTQSGRVATELGTAYKGDPIKTIRYYVKMNETATTWTWKLIIGQVVPYTLDMQIYSVPMGDHNPYIFTNDKIWLGAFTVKWDRAVTDPTKPYLSAYGTYSVPLGVWIQDYDLMGFVDQYGRLTAPDPNMVSYAQLTPSYDGRWFTLYSEPSDIADLGSLYQNPDQTVANLNTVLEGNPLPDTRFSDKAFFSITLDRFGCYKSWNWWRFAYDYFYPSVKYRLYILYLQLGEFTFTIDKSMTPLEWEERQSQIIIQPSIFDILSYAFGNFLAWLTSPLTTFGAFLILGIALLISAVVFLAYTGLGGAVRRWASTKGRGRSKMKGGGR